MSEKKPGKFVDDFDGYWTASRGGWAERYCSHWMREGNPEGFVSCDWQVSPSLHLSVGRSQNRGEKERFGAWVEDKHVGHFSTMEDARQAAEKAGVGHCKEIIATLREALRTERALHGALKVDV